VKPAQSTVLLIGMLLTLAAVFAHQLLPERRLSLDSTRPDAIYFTFATGAGTPPKVDWVDQPRFHYTCRFATGTVGQDCSFMYQLFSTSVEHGVDLSRYRALKLAIRYTGSARYVRVAIRNFDPRFSRATDDNSTKFNSISLHPKDLVQPLSIGLNELTVPEWWVDQYQLPRNLMKPDVSNAIALSVDLLGDLAGTEHDIQIDRIEFVGDWISAEHWYLGILCAWMLAGTSYGVSRWVVLRRKHREQRRKIRDLESEKEKYQRLSTLDGLTKVLNRHGIEQFIESLRKDKLPTSVIVIDLDHFKRVNDERGHYVGDRVLQTVGEILRAHSRNTDGLGRWGGEEFVLVCPGANLAKAADLAEKLRHRIMQTSFIPEDPLQVTASFGVAVAAAGESFEDAFRQADQALYLAKSRGRNAVVAAAEDQMHRVTGARKGTWALISGRFKLHR
jgi:diguanylate cyclase (GGDEF)-like protein